MFKEIRFKITSFNTIILIAFLSIFIFSIIFLIKWNLLLSGQYYLRTIANELTVEDNPDEISLMNTSFHEGLGYSFIIWSDNKTLESQQDATSQMIEGGLSILNENNIDEYKTIHIQNDEYRVFTQEDENGYVQVFQNIDAENEIISYLSTFLIVIGLVGIILLIPISYFLAGKSLQPIKTTFEEQKQFIANASHELRSPLTVIQTSVDVLKIKEDQKISENLKWIDNVEKESQNMSTLVSEMLLVTQANSGRLGYQKEDISLSAIFLEVCELIRPEFKKKNILLQTQIQPGVDFIGDEDKLSRVIRIFLDNALKYTKEDGKVLASLSQDKRFIKLQFQDNGIGIDESDQKKIFDRFYRVDRVRNTQSPGGYGLGLNIAATIIEHYNGRIQTKSKLNEGTLFTVTLPNNS